MATDTPMQLGMVGLGRMGAGIVRRLLQDGHHCVGYDIHADAVEAVVADGADGASTSGAATFSIASGVASRLTSTRFFFTSTWIVRALPVLSDFLISVVWRRVSVILFFVSFAP